MNLNQITIQSNNVNRALQFYLKLGLQLIVDSSPRYVRLACPKGDSTFSINHSENRVNDSTTLYFEVTDVDRISEQLQQQGIVFKTSPKDQRWLWREADLVDPDGHHLKLYHAGENRKNPPWRVRKKHWFEHISDSPYNLMK